MNGCPGCASDVCPCTARATKAATTPETIQQAHHWETVKSTYVADGFCEPCAVQAAYGHQVGFSQVAPACHECAGQVPSYRRAGSNARLWAQETALEPGPEPRGVLHHPRTLSSPLTGRSEDHSA